MEKQVDDRRAATRFELKEALELKIVFSSENPGLLGKRLNGSTIDISATGLRIELNHAVKIDSVLDVWVTLKGKGRKYFLTGNVRWCDEKESNDGFLIGIVLRERADTVTDLVSWQDEFKH